MLGAGPALLFVLRSYEKGSPSFPSVGKLGTTDLARCVHKSDTGPAPMLILRHYVRGPSHEPPSLAILFVPRQPPSAPGK